MNLAAISHRTSDHGCYAIDDNTIEINLKTGVDVDQVYIYHGDPFAGGILGGDWQWNGEKEEVKEYCELPYHKLWTIRLNPPFKRVKYHFEVISGDESYYYFEDGFYKPEELKQVQKKLQCFTMPWLNPSDVNIVPSWVKDTIWYQIFPDRFCNGNHDIDDKKTIRWGSKKPSNEDIYGGDLYGIVKQLDYIKSLGISGIYMTPIFEASSTHKYDTIDYYEIDPHFGDKRIFKELVEKAHERGIKVMLDGVFNHSGRHFKPWLDVLEKGPQSQYFDWFMINQWPFNQKKRHTYDGEFYSFAFTTGMPKLNTNNPEVIEYICKIGEYWIKEFDIDGWRLDVANEVSHTFCKEFRKRMQAAKKDIYILGEIWHDSIRWLQGDEFDSVMNYPLTSAINDFWFQPHMNKKTFEHNLNDCYHRYMVQTNDCLFNLLDSHDTDRLIHRVNHQLDVFYQQLTLLFTMPGSPCIFYGTEIALEGAHDPDCRACMPWDKIEAGEYNSKINKIKQLIQLRNDFDACKSQKISFLNEIPQERVLEYEKISDDHVLHVIVNASHSDIEIHGEHILFENGYENSVLKTGGVIVMKK